MEFTIAQLAIKSDLFRSVLFCRHLLEAMPKNFSPQLLRIAGRSRVCAIFDWDSPQEVFVRLPFVPISLLGN